MAAPSPSLGPTFVFHCFNSAPLHGHALPVVYSYLNKLPLGVEVSKYIVFVDQADQQRLVECCALVQNCELAFIKDAFYDYSACDHLLWHLSTVLFPGTVILIASLDRGYYYATIKTCQDIGWHVILIHPPGVDPRLLDVVKQSYTLPMEYFDWREKKPPQPLTDGFLAQKTVAMTPLDLEGTRSFVESFQRMTVDDWPFNSRKESVLMKLMDRSAFCNDIDKTQGDVTSDELATCVSISDCGNVRLSRENFARGLNPSAGPPTPLPTLSLMFPPLQKKEFRGRNRRQDSHRRPPPKGVFMEQKRLCFTNRNMRVSFSGSSLLRPLPLLVVDKMGGLLR